MEETYRAIDKLNQSLLKKLLVSPSAFLKQRDRQEESTENHFVFGSLVDFLLLVDDDINNTKFHEKYYVLTGVDPSDAIKSIVQYVYEQSLLLEEGSEMFLENFNDLILDGCNIYNYYKNLKAETRVKKIKEGGDLYFHSLKESEGRIIINEDDYAKATMCTALVKSDPFIGKYSVASDNVTIFKHKVVEFHYKDLDFKMELDKVYVDHEAKTIQPIDYKTDGQSVYQFKFNFWKFRYDFQAATYRIGLEQDKDIQRLVESGYTLLPFLYIVIETESNNRPIAYKITNSVNSMGKIGGMLSSGRKLEGLDQAIERYKWHTENDEWQFPMEYYLKGGSLDLEV